MGVLNSFLPRGWGIRPSKTYPGGWSGLELTDTSADTWQQERQTFRLGDNLCVDFLRQIQILTA